MTPSRRATKAIPLALFAIWAPLTPLVAEPVNFFVNPLGNDSWGGQSGTPNKAGSDGPFASLARAQRALRDSLKKKEGPHTVWVHPGTYRIAEALRFTEADGGRPGAPVRWVGIGPEKARVSGGQSIKGPWTQTPGKPYSQTLVPEVKQGKWFFTSLYINGMSRPPARKPNENEVMLRGVSQAPGEASNRAFVYRPGDLNPNWQQPEDITLVLINSWTPTLHTGLRFDGEKNIVRFESTHTRPVDFFERQFRYYVSHVFEALDAPGEWYLDRKTGVLYVYPEAGLDLNLADVTAPVVMTRLLTLAPETPGATLDYLEFSGLAFEYTEGNQALHNGVYRQGHMFLGAAVYAENLRRSSFSNCEFAHLGEYALELGPGCQQNRVEKCHFYDIGAGGIQMGISDLGTLKKLEAGARETSVRVLSNTVHNNLVHRLGTRWHGCYGILNRFASYSRITHNEIYDVHWDAISSDARWDFRGEDYSRGHEVAYNRMHYLGLGYHGDAAGYYQFGPLDTWVHHNIVYDTVAYPDIHAGFAGYYLDEMSRGALVENNLAYGTDWDAYHQNWGSNNTFRNNIGAFAKSGFITRGGIPKSGRNDFVATGNIYLSSNEVAREQAWVPGSVPPVLASNLYWTLAPSKDLRFPGGKTFEETQSAGDEEGSLIADPGFRSPLTGDFTLDLKNPLWAKTGFVPFQDAWPQVGLVGEPDWVNLARQFPARNRLPVEDGEARAKRSAIHLDFESYPIGSGTFPFTLRQEGEATMRVTDVQPAGGKRCLLIIDREKGVKSFNPHLFTAFNLTRGAVMAAFDFRLDPDHPIALTLEGRGKGSVDETGPRVEIRKDGTVVAGGETLGEVPLGRWARLEVRFDLSDPRGQSTVTLKGEGIDVKREVPHVHRYFKSLTWLGIMAPLSVDGEACIDNLHLGPE